MIYDITPVPYARMTRKSKYIKTPTLLRYLAFKDECKIKKVEFPSNGASITFIIPMPKSWSGAKKERMCGEHHTQKPDLSNLLKALEDAVYKQDCIIWHYKDLKKVWGIRGAIEIHE